MLAALLMSVWSAGVAAKSSVNSVTLSSSPNPSTFGIAPTFSVQVAAPAGSVRPTGTVTMLDFLVSGGSACTANLGSGPAANIAVGVCTATSGYAAGVHNVSAIYNGDSNYNTGFSDAMTHTVLPSFTLTADAGAGGTVNPGSYTLVPQNGTVIFDFTPSTGFRIASVTGVAAGCRVISAPLSGNVVRYTLSQITANCSLSATFTNLYTVTFAADVGGTVSPSGDQRVVFGSTPTITVTPNLGFRLVNVTGCGVVFFGGTAITGPTT